MNPIDKKLQELKKQERLGLMTHVVIGYPSLPKTEEVVLTMNDAGVDFIELQIPFSDPLADGSTIMKACEESLKQGTKVADAFSLAKILSKKIKTPLLFMGYYNSVFKYGVEKFCKDAKKVGISGLIIPDVPLEEESEEHFIENCEINDLYSIRVISPASTQERLRKNAKVAKGFVYCTARQGITGARNKLDPKIKSYLNLVKKEFAIPVAVGFGISKKEHLKTIKGSADIAVVGSALLDIINHSSDKTLNSNIRKFILDLKVV